MSYADLHPVSSPYSRGGQGPISITVGGVHEETELVTQTPWSEQMEWDFDSDGPAATTHSDEMSSLRGTGWDEMDWEPVQHPASVSSPRAI